MHTLPNWLPSWLPRFVQRHKSVVTGFLDYDDVMGELVLHLWNRRQQGKTLITRRLVGWMITSMTRRAYARNAHQMQPLDTVSIPSNPHDRLEARSALFTLKTAVEELRPQVRELIELVACGNTVRDASLQLGLTPATGHRWFQGAKSHLKSSMMVSTCNFQRDSRFSYAV